MNEERSSIEDVTGLRVDDVVDNTSETVRVSTLVEWVSSGAKSVDGELVSEGEVRKRFSADVPRENN